jgi:phosphatidylserine/phosphatidylglycerophosphate/cardiolipin synthase-like enzyme
MIGALKLTSMKVPVFGFVSNVEDHARLELVDFPTEAPNLNAHVIQPQEGAFDAPHQKLIVVDGLLAFKGSTNLTNRAMRKADRGLDLSETVTDFEKVTELNNRYFAPVWKKLANPSQDEVLMSDPPF